MKFLKIVLSALVLGFSFVSYSFAESPYSIVRVGVDLSQQTFFVGVSPVATNSPCTRKDEFKWSLASPGTKELMAVVMSAQAQGKRIYIQVDGNFNNCVANQATGAFVYIAD
jgi:hypothetical protein